MMTSDERTAVLEDEQLILSDSGEIPEIAYHATLYFLTEDAQGPKMNLSQKEICLLQDAALGRYQEIVLRDITSENRDQSIYRGVRRTLYNWERMQAFCARIKRDCSSFRSRVRHSFLAFFQQEVADVASGRRKSVVNCSAEMIDEFCLQLELDTDCLPENWQNVCKPG